MQIVIDRIYNGGGLRELQPGVYDIDDERLQGQGERLVKARVAFLTTSPEAPKLRPAPVGVEGIDWAAPDAEDGFGGESSEDDEDNDGGLDDTPIALVYIGANPKEHAVKIGGDEYVVPKAEGDAPRTVTVPAYHVEGLIARTTFKAAESEG